MKNLYILVQFHYQDISLRLLSVFSMAIFTIVIPSQQ